MKNQKKIRLSFFALALACLLLFVVGGQFVKLAEANFFPTPIPQPAYIIKSDGSIDPPNAPIYRTGNSYTLTENIEGYTVAVERDGIELDGNGYYIKGNGNSTGLFLKNLKDITVKNMEISGCTYGIRLFGEDVFSMSSFGNTLKNNTLTENKYGLYMSYSWKNVLQNNSMSNNSRNFWINGGFITESGKGYVNDIDTSNTVDGKPVIYMVNKQGETVPTEAGYVAIINCTNITANGLILSNNSHGILVAESTNVQISNCRLETNDNGIQLYNSTGIVINQNTITDNNEGVRLYYSSGNQITSNNITSNKSGLYFTNYSINNTISNNAITENSVDGINLWGSTNTTIQQNVIAYNNETGINFFESSRNTIITNDINDNTGIGIKMWFDASENNIEQNNITNNNIGILINDSYDNTLTKNTIKENIEWGMRFEDTQNNNKIYLNNFINNRPGGDGWQVSITGVGILDPKPGGGNLWDNGTVGNYWSDYSTAFPNAKDEGSGTGDVPLVINENNIDRHPILEPVAIPEFSSFMILMLFVGLASCIIIYKRRRRL